MFNFDVIFLSNIRGHHALVILYIPSYIPVMRNKLIARPANLLRKSTVKIKSY